MEELQFSYEQVAEDYVALRLYHLRSSKKLYIILGGILLSSLLISALMMKIDSLMSLALEALWALGFLAVITLCFLLLLPGRLRREVNSGPGQAFWGHRQVMVTPTNIKILFGQNVATIPYSTIKKIDIYQKTLILVERYQIYGFPRRAFASELQLMEFLRFIEHYSGKTLPKDKLETFLVRQYPPLIGRVLRFSTIASST